jgi:hypothetical protein
MSYYKLKKEIKSLKEINEIAISETVFNISQEEFLLNIISEMSKLLEEGIKPHIIAIMIKNAKEKYFLNRIIHNSKL